MEGVEDQAKLLAPYTVAYVIGRAAPERRPPAGLHGRHRSGEPVQVVCGAPNARTGMKTVFSPPGTYIPGKNITLGVGTIRGVESRGMLCSAMELGLGEDHDGIIDLPADAPSECATRNAGLGDAVIDFAVTPNRPDCAGRARRGARPRRRRPRQADREVRSAGPPADRTRVRVQLGFEREDAISAPAVRAAPRTRSQERPEPANGCSGG